jgi:hypothetical protein
MAEDWIDALVGAAPHLPGLGALGFAVVAFFRAGRGVGKTEARFDRHEIEHGELKARVDKVEIEHAEIKIAHAAMPTREEIRLLFSEAREDNRALFSELREDIRAFNRPR